MISTVVFDIDGVLTNGCIHVDQAGNEFKTYNITEIDALNDIKRMGYIIVAVTGECTPIVDVFRQRVPWDRFIFGCKDKKAALKELETEYQITREAICYVGDGKYDIPAIEYAGVGVCPQNSIPDVKSVSDIVLKESGGGHCVTELCLLLKTLSEDGMYTSDRFADYCKRGLTVHLQVFDALQKSIPVRNEMSRAAEIVLRTIQSGGAIYLCGNGGSAADSQHIATEFVSRFYKERPAFNAESLTVNTSSLTAIGNDYDFERVFVRQLEAKAKPGDTLIGISTSGSSKNVIRAIEYAAKNKIHTILLTGSQERKYDVSVYECVVKVPSEDTPRIQEGHIFIGHMIAEYVEAMLSESDIKQSKWGQYR